MIKLAKYLKPYVMSLIFCVLLLFGQAMCDLSLPNLMSDIVNVGIQERGIENPTPEIMSEKAYNLITIFMSEADKQIFSKNYSYIQTGKVTNNYNEYIKKYPLLEDESIYILKKDNKTDLDALSKLYSKSTMAMIISLKSLASNLENGSQFNTDDVTSLKFTDIYYLTPIFQSLPAEAIDKSIEDASKVDSALSRQIATAITQKFYTEAGVDLGALQNRYTTKIGIYMIVLTLLGAAATMSVSFLSSRISAGVSKVLRRDIFRKVESFSNNEFDKFSTASLITRTTNDVTQVQTIIMMGIRMIVYAPIMGIGGTILALEKCASMGWIIALNVLVILGIISIVFSITMPKFKSIQKLIDKLNLVTREHLSGMMVIRAFGTQKFEENRFDNANKNLTDVNKFVNRMICLLMPAMMFLMNAISLLIVWVGSNEISKANMQVGDMMAFMQYAMQIIISFLVISMIFILVPRAAVSADRIAEVLYTDIAIKDEKKPIKLPENHSGKIEFKNVSFKYEGADEYVLENISFTALPGKTTAFIGATGSGKSTLVNLIPRFYDVTEGEILIDNINIKSISQQELHDNIGYVPQKGILFSGTIASNIAYGKKDANEIDITEAAEVAQASEFIEGFKGKYYSEISQGGSNVSGGQKQRLSIARALIKKAKVYIFDDSFSALDFKTDAMLRKALTKYTKHSTVFIVAQRISTIMNAEQIIVLDEGKIVGKGTHEELLETCDTYKEIALSQLSKEEL